MKKKFIISFFLLILLLLFNNQKNVYGEWFKFKENPIIPNNVDKKNLINNPRSPAVIFENNLYKMWFSNLYNNKWSIDFIFSSDLIHWIKPKDEPLIQPDQTENELMGPNILKIDDTYYLWYSSYENTFKIKLATSKDGFNWTKKNTVINPTNWWEEKGVVNPYVLYINNKFYMWYGGWGNDGIWRIGLATSIDGINWQKYQNNPLYISPNLLHIGNHNLKYYDNKFHLWYLTGNGIVEEIYHLTSLNGINWECIENDSCLILRKNGIDFPNKILNDSDTLLLNDNKIILFFCGLHDNIWGIGIASNNPMFLDSSPIILLPGLFASWNKSAIFYNQPVGIFDWKLLPFVKEYNGLINTLKNLGYQENQDFFVFPYDWRKSIDQSSDDLKTFIETKIPQDKKVNLIGHSLGGLVARLFTQKNKDKVNKLITVGSPHQGAGQSYKAVEGGELESNNTWQWLGQKLLLQIYKDGIKTDKQIINEKLPVVRDLLPTYNFLKNVNGETININNMTIKNNTLLNYNSNINEIFSFLSTITGENNNQTIWGYKVRPRTIFDLILDYYPDGRPIETIYDIGDGTVISLSSKIGENKETFNFNHGEIIYKKPAIKKILEILNLNYQEEQIVESEGTKTTPSLIISLLSPATMSATFNQSTFNEYEGLIFIENAQTGDYQLKVSGINEGKYKLIIGQITDKGDYWQSIENKTSTNKLDNYLINFNQEQPKESFIDEGNIEKIKENIINELTLINEPKNFYINLAIKKLKNLKKAEEILIVHSLLFNTIKKNNQEKWNNIFLIINKLENLYHLLAKKSIFKQNLLNLELKLTDGKIKLIEKNLINKKKKEELSNQHQIFYQLIKEKFEKAKKSYQENNYPLTEIILKTTNELIILINKI